METRFWAYGEWRYGGLFRLWLTEDEFSEMEARSAAWIRKEIQEDEDVSIEECEAHGDVACPWCWNSMH